MRHVVSLEVGIRVLGRDTSTLIVDTYFEFQEF